jgi:hypothetical protein
MHDLLFQKISEILKSDFKNAFKGAEVILQDSTSKPVKFKKMGSFLCIQPDKKIKEWKTNFPFFESSIEGACSVADHIIFYPKAHTLFVFLIELKTTNTTGALEQIRANYELGKYICGTAKRLLKNPFVEIQYRGLIFSNKTFNRTSKPKQTYHIDQNSELQFRYLQSGTTYDLDTLSH